MQAKMARAFKNREGIYGSGWDNKKIATLAESLPRDRFN